jgi:hypothetical protein
MTSSLPAHLSEVIRLRIAWLREASLVEAAVSPLQPPSMSASALSRPLSRAGRSGVTTPTFPQPHSHDSRSKR